MNLFDTELSKQCRHGQLLTASTYSTTLLEQRSMMRLQDLQTIQTCHCQRMSKTFENIWNHNIMTCRSIQRLSLPSKPDHWKPESKYVQIWKQGGPENTKARRRTARLFLKSCGVGNCAPHEIDVKSLLKHRAHWWYQGSRLQFTTACCVSYVYILLVAISVNVINSIPSF